MQQALFCKLVMEEGIEVHELSAELAYNLLRLFRPDSEASPDSSTPGGASSAAGS